jgi:CheY-like chemotaxis protein
MTKRARLFIVEDHPTTARALKMYLEAVGYAVTIAADVASALKMADNEPFDLLICDLSLPDGTGWDLMKKLSSKRPVRGIAFTASGAPEDIARSERAGFIKHIVKGCSAEELTQVIKETLKAQVKSPPMRSSDTARRVRKSAA